jgi:hypothetical protein
MSKLRKRRIDWSVVIFVKASGYLPAGCVHPKGWMHSEETVYLVSILARQGVSSWLRRGVYALCLIFSSMSSYAESFDSQQVLSIEIRSTMLYSGLLFNVSGTHLVCASISLNLPRFSNPTAAAANRTGCSINFCKEHSPTLVHKIDFAHSSPPSFFSISSSSLLSCISITLFTSAVLRISSTAPA